MELNTENFLTLTAAGLTIDQIAERTGVSYRKVKTMSEAIPANVKEWARREGQHARCESRRSCISPMQRMKEKEIAEIYARHGGKNAYK